MVIFEEFPSKLGSGWEFPRKWATVSSLFPHFKQAPVSDFLHVVEMFVEGAMSRNEAHSSSVVSSIVNGDGVVELLGRLPRSILICCGCCRYSLQC